MTNCLNYFSVPQRNDAKIHKENVTLLRIAIKLRQEKIVLGGATHDKNTSPVWRQAIREINFAKFSYLVEEAIQPYRRIATQQEIEDFQQEGYGLLWDLVCRAEYFLSFEESAAKTIRSHLRTLRRSNNLHYKIISKLARLDLQLLHCIYEQQEGEELQSMMEKAFSNLSLKQVRVLKAIFGLEQSPTAHNQLAIQERMSRQSLWKLKKQACKKLSEDEELRLLM
ncbi:MAG: hypothetical protein KME35_03840 [Aphanocapsa sp. GSE-SYN-MK-11-07L]|jgi:hypothetical protein|nr:hypothetical protein [Aphanocapsa sp. GSE-SYN-MK-11-07L]